MTTYDFVCMAQPWKDGHPAQTWVYQVSAMNYSEAGAIAMRCVEIGCALDGLELPGQLLVEPALSDRAQEWLKEESYDFAWPADYCADVARRHGLAKEAKPARRGKGRKHNLRNE